MWVARAVSRRSFGWSAGSVLAAFNEVSALEAAKTESALEPKLRQLAALAAQVRAALKRLGGASKEGQRALGRELQTAARESKTIGKGFK